MHYHYLRLPFPALYPSNSNVFAALALPKAGGVWISDRSTAVGEGNEFAFNTAGSSGGAVLVTIMGKERDTIRDRKHMGKENGALKR